MWSRCSILREILVTKNLGLSWEVQDTIQEAIELYFYDDQLGFAIGGKGNYL